MSATLHYCPTCGTRLETTTSPGGLPRRTCPECGGDER
ncbi:zf-TFIIB domain-containing protein [Halarchaeum grantii]|nr:zf-TFIIB domain-containing protein [Halarchaeum grantii]